MFKNSLKQALRHRTLTIGSWLQAGHPANAEILAQAGFDWLAVDCEHGEVVPEELGNLFRAMLPSGTIPMVRVKANDTLEIRRALDLGAMGVIVPLVETADEARHAVAAAKYPPAGVRGFAFHRGNNWGMDFDEYARRANDEIVVIVMIESQKAVRNIDSILAVDGVDGVFIGPYDMSGSYGIIGRTGDPIIKNASRTVSESCAKAEKSAGMHIVLPTGQEIQEAVNQGFNFLGLGMDTVFLANGAKQCIDFTKGLLKQ